MTQPTIILITESTSESWKRDASTFCLAFACFVPGWFLGMWSMSILGFLIFAYMTARAVIGVGSKAMSPDEARRMIDEIEAAHKDHKP